jgi:hypothetical protein
MQQKGVTTIENTENENTPQVLLSPSPVKIELSENSELRKLLSSRRLALA